MAPQGGKRFSLTSDGEGIVFRVSTAVLQSLIVNHGKRAASDAAYVTKCLVKNTGKAAWITGMTFLILFLPLIIEMDCEQHLNELELQQASLLNALPVGLTQK